MESQWWFCEKSRMAVVTPQASMPRSASTRRMR
jgi:hypothetical protein